VRYPLNQVNFMRDFSQARAACGTTAGLLLIGAFIGLPAEAETIYATKGVNGRVAYTNVPTSPESKVYLEVAALQLQTFASPIRRKELPVRSVQTTRVLLPDALAVHVEHAARVHGVEADLIAAVIKVESGFNTRAVSPKGARGLMQLMPGTGKRYGAVDLHDPRINVLAGTAYLRDLLLLFRGRLDLALAGYNAGENAVLRYNERIPPYAETQHYVTAVLSEYRRLRASH
jgi:soluble lytic murein transglycosylase-like protein